MVHADSSNFAAGVGKKEAYEQVIEQATALFDGQRNWVWYASWKNPLSELPSNPNNTNPPPSQKSNTSNTASLLWHALHALPRPSSAVNWAGFYVLDPSASSSSSKPQLILGPFQGKVACQTIAFGRGVCGAAAAGGRTQLVPDVELFPGHIACDGESRSEVVVPILVEGKVVAIIDIDCAEPDGFDEVDREYLERLAGILGEGCDW